MTLTHIFSGFAAGFLLLAACGCSDARMPAYSHFEQIGAGGWDPLDLLVFEPWTADSADARLKAFDLDLVLRYSVRHPVSDLPVAVTVEDEDGVLRSDTIIVRYGQGGNVTSRLRYGVREAVVRLESNVRLRDGYAVSLSPVASRERTDGLLNVGLVMTAAGSNAPESAGK